MVDQFANRLRGSVREDHYSSAGFRALAPPKKQEEKNWGRKEVFSTTI